MILKQTYLTLPNDFYTVLNSTSNYKLEEVLWNSNLEKSLGLSFSSEADKMRFLKGKRSDQKLYAQAYAGHQYGHFTMLGDGRAMMLGEVESGGTLQDVQLKGSGRTPYSRRGDGKATLESMLREYIMSESMHHLGVPTTRTLGVFKTNETIQRTQSHQGAMMIRVAASHIRVGTFEYARALDDTLLLEQLLDYTIERHVPHITSTEHKVTTLFYEVVKRQASLIAQWQSLGFVHGVLNTDNVAISGQTIDYGPCAFLDQYEPEISFSSIDRQGRYSYIRQPYIGSWNLSKFAMTLLPLMGSNLEDSIQHLNQILVQYETIYQQEYLHRMGRKLGLENPRKEDLVLIEEWLRLLRDNQADFTNSFYYLTTGEYDKLPFTMIEWTLFHDSWMTRILEDGSLADAQARMRQVNPVVIPRNHLIKSAVDNADFNDDMTLFNHLLPYLRNPYDYEVEIPSEYQQPNPRKTPFVSYCGT